MSSDIKIEDPMAHAPAKTSNERDDTRIVTATFDPRLKVDGSGLGVIGDRLIPMYLGKCQSNLQRELFASIPNGLQLKYITMLSPINRTLKAAIHYALDIGPPELRPPFFPTFSQADRSALCQYLASLLPAEYFEPYTPYVFNQLFTGATRFFKEHGATNNEVIGSPARTLVSSLTARSATAPNLTDTDANTMGTSLDATALSSVEGTEVQDVGAKDKLKKTKKMLLAAQASDDLIVDVPSTPRVQKSKAANIVDLELMARMPLAAEVESPREKKKKRKQNSDGPEADGNMECEALMPPIKRAKKPKGAQDESRVARGQPDLAAAVAAPAPVAKPLKATDSGRASKGSARSTRLPSHFSDENEASSSSSSDADTPSTPTRRCHQSRGSARRSTIPQPAPLGQEVIDLCSDDTPKKPKIEVEDPQPEGPAPQDIKKTEIIYTVDIQQEMLLEKNEKIRFLEAVLEKTGFGKDEIEHVQARMKKNTDSLENAIRAAKATKKEARIVRKEKRKAQKDGQRRSA